MSPAEPVRVAFALVRAQSPVGTPIGPVPTLFTGARPPLAEDRGLSPDIVRILCS